MAFLVRHRFLMKDGGAGARSKEWGAFGSIYDIVMVINLPGSVNQMGAIERHLGILKIGIEKIHSYDKTSSLGDSLRRACIGKDNTVLMSSGGNSCSSGFREMGISPSLENGIVPPFSHLSSTESMRQHHSKSIFLARNAMQTYDAEMIISLFLRSNLIADQKNIPSIGNASHVAPKGNGKADFVRLA